MSKFPSLRVILHCFDFLLHVDIHVNELPNTYVNITSTAFVSRYIDNRELKIKLLLFIFVVIYIM